MAEATTAGRDGIARPRRFTLGAGLALLVVVAGALRLWDIGRQSLWSDELFSVFWSQRGLGYILGEGRWVETNPPFYYVLLSLWSKLFGTSEVAVRLLSVVFSLATLPLVYRVGSILCGRAAGAVAAALFAVSGLQVYYAQEARGYSLFALTAAVIFLGSARLLRSGTAPVPRVGPLAAAALPFVLGAILALYTHATGIVLVAAVDIVLLVTAAVAARRGPLLAVVILANLVIAAAAPPEMQVLLWQSHSANLSWMPSVGFRLTAATIEALLTGYPLTLAFADGPLGLFAVLLAFSAFLVLVGAALFRCVTRYRRDWPIVAQCLLLPVTGLVLFVALSRIQPILLDRTAIWLTLPGYWAIGAGVAAIGPRGRRALLFAGLVAIESGFAVMRLETDEREPWRRLIGAVEKEWRPGDIVVLTAESRARTPAIAVAYYWEGRALPELRRWAACPGGCPTTSEAVLDAAVAPAPPIHRAEIAALLAQGRSIWVVSRTPLGPADEAEIAPLYRSMGNVARITAQLRWETDIEVSRWQR